MFARTERLLLRPGWREDAPALFDAVCDERVVRNLAQAPWPYTPQHAEAFLARERGATDTSSLIFLRMSSAPRLVGCIGVHRLPSGEDELGYWITRPYWNRGFATEACRAVIEIARTLGLPQLQGAYFIDNPASGRVLEKLGFLAVGITAPRMSCARGAESDARLLRLVLADEEAEAIAA